MSGIIQVNGETRALTVGTVTELLRAEAIDPAAKGVAVALNGAVAPRPTWDDTPLKPGDQIEIVKPFAGG